MKWVYKNIETGKYYFGLDLPDVELHKAKKFDIYGVLVSRHYNRIPFINIKKERKHKLNKLLKTF